METKDIKIIEASYSCWMVTEIEGLKNAELWKSGRVKKFWLKNCELHMELDDGTIVKEYVYTEMLQDAKWPTEVLISDDDGSNWHIVHHRKNTSQASHPKSLKLYKQ